MFQATQTNKQRLNFLNGQGKQTEVETYAENFLYESGNFSRLPDGQF